ncbi:MAG: PhoU domain-containing protein [Planctomycetota bacterium]
MLSELLKMWRKIDLVKQALENFLSMIDLVESTFAVAADALLGKTGITDAKEIIYKTDIKVNKTERNIRKDLVKHLAVNPRGDAPACLILMSASKDAERAGDYCKNLLGVAGMLREPMASLKYADDVREMIGRVRATFGKTRQAFAEDDQTLGHGVIVEETQIAKRSDAMVEKIANDDSLNANQAVCLALTFRFLKRVNAHLGNIASSVVMPLHKIDYFDEKWMKKEGQGDEENDS